jgi:hypothetical protein
MDANNIWNKDKKLGGLTRGDGRYNLRRRTQHHLMVAVYTVLRPAVGEGPVYLRFEGAYDSVERAIRKTRDLDRELNEAERRAEYEASNRWMYDCK